MTQEQEQEAFSLVLERQKNGASENDIRTAFQRFLETVGVAAASEMTTAVAASSPGTASPPQAASRATRLSARAANPASNIHAERPGTRLFIG